MQHFFEFDRGPRAPRAAVRHAALWAASALCVVFPACQNAERPLPRALAAKDGADAPQQDIWEAFYLQDSKIGHGHTTERPQTRNGQALVRVDSLNHLSISRFGQRTEQDFQTSTLETPDGRVIELHTEVAFGPSPTLVDGHVEGRQMVIETHTKGSQTTDRIAWSDEIRGFRAVEQSLERQPLKAGEKRTLKMLMPLINQVADVELTARDFETTTVLGVQTKLLRIETVARLPDGNRIGSTQWTDAQGQTIKTRVEALQQESYRTTRELAIAEQPAGATFDLGSDLIVKPPRPLANPHQTREVRYRVELASEDPAKVFASGATQAVRSVNPHTAEVTVRSLRPRDLPPADKASEPVAAKYTAANNVLQIDDPRVQAMAREGKGNAANTRDVAIGLERYVHRVMTKKNFKQAFATAAEVAESREGDCSEHAVLLAALARACQIPSRVAIGLVYVDSAAGFGYHMWTEMYLDGWWVPMDAVLGQGGTSAAYLKLTDTSLDGPAAYSSFLPVAQVVGQLKINVLAAE